MHTRVSRRKLKELEDTNSLAARIVAQATSQSATAPVMPPIKEKNAAAVALGKLGASKGGTARAKALSKERRVAIAKNAAKNRWSRRKS